MTTASPEKAPPKETWLDWIPDGYPVPPEDEWIGRDDLLAQVRSRGLSLSPRTLGLWEASGIVPRPVRRWHNGATRALYPPWAAQMVMLANEVKDDRSDAEDVSQTVRILTKYVIRNNEVWQWSVVNQLLPAVLNNLADYYQESFGERPNSIDIRINNEKGQPLTTLEFDTSRLPNQPARNNCE